jgi:hypothetical protein
MAAAEAQRMMATTSLTRRSQVITVFVSAYRRLPVRSVTAGCLVGGPSHVPIILQHAFQILDTLAQVSHGSYRTDDGFRRGGPF